MSDGGPRYRALIVDFGGVLTTPLQDAMRAFAEDLGIELQDLVRVALRVYAGEDDGLVAAFETGRISEDDFAAAFAARLSEVTPRPVDPAGVVDGLFEGMTLEDSMLDALLAVRKAGLKTGLLSNSWSLRHYPRERFAELFDAVVISGEVGLRKPDPAIFELVLGRLDVEPGRAVFVDDHPGHLKAAVELGIKTVLHRSPTQTLAELEVLLGVALAPPDGAATGSS